MEEVLDLCYLTDMPDSPKTKKIWNLGIRAYKAGFKNNDDAFGRVYKEAYDSGLFGSEESAELEGSLRKVYWDLRSKGKVNRAFIDRGCEEEKEEVRSNLWQLINQTWMSDGYKD